MDLSTAYCMLSPLHSGRMGLHKYSQDRRLHCLLRWGETEKNVQGSLLNATVALLKEQGRREQQACLWLPGFVSFSVPPRGQASFPIFQVTVPVGCLHGDLPDPDT